MSIDPTARPTGPHPVHALLLSFPVALFTTALATDVAYLKTAEIQWTNFSSWLITGGLVFGGVTLAWAALALIFRLSAPGRARRAVYLLVLAAMWVAGLINAFQHSRDAWSSVGAVGLTLSIVTTVLAIAAGTLAFSGWASANGTLSRRDAV